MRRLKKGLCAALCLLSVLPFWAAAEGTARWGGAFLRTTPFPVIFGGPDSRATVMTMNGVSADDGIGAVTLDVRENDPAGCVVVINNAADQALRDVLLRETVSGTEKLLRFLPAAEMTQVLWTAGPENGGEMRFELTLPDGSMLCTRTVEAALTGAETEAEESAAILPVMDGPSFRMAENPQTYRTMMLMTGGLLVTLLLLWWIVSDIRERRMRRLRAKKKQEKRKQRQQFRKNDDKKSEAKKI